MIIISAIVLSLIHDFRNLQYYEWSHHVTHTLRSHSSIFLSSSSFYVLSIVIIIFCLFRWSYYAICSWAVCCERIHTFLRMFCLLLSIVLHQCLSRRIDVVSLVWVSLKCLNCNNSFVARRYLNILTISLSEWWFWNNQKEEEHFFEDVNSMY
jgi:hypothetical protein